MFGRVSFINVEKGYGFLLPNGDTQRVFFHISQVRAPLLFDEELENERVDFEIGYERGRPRAVNVRMAKP